MIKRKPKKPMNLSIPLLKYVISPILVFIIGSFLIGTFPPESGPILKYSYHQLEDKIEFSVVNDALRHSATNVYVKLNFVPSSEDEWRYVVFPAMVAQSLGDQNMMLSREKKLGTLPPNSPQPTAFEIMLMWVPRKTLQECTVSNVGSGIPAPPCLHGLAKDLRRYGITKEIFALEIGCNECKKITTNITINSIITDGCDYNENYTYCWVKEDFLI